MPFTVVVPDIHLFNDDKQEFINIKGETFKIEHSLVSVAKWEAKWHKPFLSKDVKTEEEFRDYIKCMTLTQNVRPEIYDYIPVPVIQEIIKYTEDPMTATTISNTNKKTSRKIITAEVIYGWMIGLNMPVEVFQKWHLNRLMTLIEVVNEQNNPSKKMSKRETLASNRALNEARRKRLHTKG